MVKPPTFKEILEFLQEGYERECGEKTVAEPRRMMSGKSGPSYDQLAGLTRFAEERGQADREYTGRRRQYMRDGLPYDTHRPSHYIERYGMRTYYEIVDGAYSEIILGVFKDTPARMAVAVVLSRTSDHGLTH